jgi:hypothetical protein
MKGAEAEGVFGDLAAELFYDHIPEKNPQRPSEIMSRILLGCRCNVFRREGRRRFSRRADHCIM